MKWNHDNDWRIAYYLTVGGIVLFAVFMIIAAAMAKLDVWTDMNFDSIYLGLNSTHPFIQGLAVVILVGLFAAPYLISKIRK